jgi:glycosyltransferase involved in cell wall biosynthesis
VEDLYFRPVLRSDTCVIIPCFNEGSSIGPLVRAVSPRVSAVWVIDDGSTDLTAENATSNGARLLKHPVRMGKGRALRSGLLEARKAGFAFALTMDGDGQHEPAEIPKFLQAADNFDLVVGNRMHSRDKIPLVRRVTNQFMSSVLSRFLKVKLPDSQCGFRLVRLNALPEQLVESTAFEVESELLVAVIKAGRKVGFVDVSVIYGAERSKIRPVRDSFRWVFWLIQTAVKYRLNPLRNGFPNRGREYTKPTPVDLGDSPT